MNTTFIKKVTLVGFLAAALAVAALLLINGTSGIGFGGVARANVVATTCPTSGSPTITTTCDLAPGTYTYGTLTVSPTGVMRLHVDVSLPGFKGVHINADHVSVQAGGIMTADEEGYPVASGPGAGPFGGEAGGPGAGHGGMGGEGPFGNPGGASYDSATEPTEPGSGGYHGGVAGSAKGDGGGVIRLAVSGTTIVDGIISANGRVGDSPVAHPFAGGGGSGGTVRITTGTLSGSGTIRANGGPGGTGTSLVIGGGGGAGGRTAITYGTLTFTGTTQALGAAGGTGNPNRGEDGTISINSVVGGLCNIGTPATTCTMTGPHTSPNLVFTFTSPLVFNLGSNLRIKNLYSVTLNAPTINQAVGATLDIIAGGTATLISSTPASLTMAGATTLGFGITTLNLRGNAITVSGSVTAPPVAGFVTAATTINVDELTPGTGTFTLSGGLAAQRVNVKTKDVSISSTGSISADHRGFGTAGIGTSGGPGGGIFGGAAGGTGAGHGGVGGANGAGNPGGPAYGSASDPISAVPSDTDLGSGGYPGGVIASSKGSGGGAVRIAGSGAVTINGLLSAHGAAGDSPVSHSNMGGGGSGGSIEIEAGTLAGTGSIRANGGAGGVSPVSPALGDGGCGAGGRIALLYSLKTHSGLVEAIGGCPAKPLLNGGAGTVFDDAPDTTITSSPLTATPDTIATFAFTSNEAATFECSLDGAAFSVCTSPKTYTGLAVGSHTFSVRATDLKGNLDTTPATFSWTIVTAGQCIAPGIPPPLQMVGWWPGDGTANDIIGTNHGTLNNGATFATGKVQQAFRLDGINDFVSIPNSANWEFGNRDFTIDFWVNKVSNLHGYIARDGTTLYAPWIIGSNDMVYMTSTGSSWDIVSGASMGSIPASTWIHIAVVRSGSTFRVYNNGNIASTWTSSASIASNANPLSIGKVQSQTNFNGMIDELEIFSRALTQAEIQSIFNAGSAGKCKALSITTTTLPDNTVGVAASHQISAFGGTSPLTFALVSGTLPTGMTLSTSGVLSGTPTTAGIFTFTVSATDATGATATQTITKKVVVGKVIGSLFANRDGFSLIDGMPVAGSYEAKKFLVNDFSTVTGIPLQFKGLTELTDASLSEIDALNIVFDIQSQTQKIPVLSASEKAAVRKFVENGGSVMTFAGHQAAQSAVDFYNVFGVGLIQTCIGGGTVNPTTSMPSAIKSGPFGQVGTVSWGSDCHNDASQGTGVAIMSGTNKEVVLVDSDVLSPGSGPVILVQDYLAGYSNFAYAGFPSLYKNLANYAITRSSVKKEFRITTTALPDNTVGVFASHQIGTAFGTAPVTFSLISGALPTGMTLSTSGVLSGTPTTVGAFTFTVKVTDSVGGTATKTLTKNVVAALACTPPPPQMVSWWPFDETTGTTATDITDNNPGTLVNGPVYTTGKVANGLSFDGVNDKVSVPDSAAWDFGTGGMSIDFWTKLNTIKNTVFIQHFQDSANRWTFFLQSGLLYFQYYKNGGVTVNLGGVPHGMTAGAFHQLAVTRVGNTWIMYRDGTPIASTSAAADVSGLTGQIIMGVYAGGAGYELHGLLDEVEIFNKGLSAAEIQSIFNAGSGGKCKVPADTTPPETTLTGTPPALTNSISATLTFSSNEAGSTFACQLDGGGFSACTSPKSYTGLSDGNHTFQVKATDAAGNTDPTPASFTWTVDTVTPNTTITSAPPALTANTGATFSFSSNETASFECKLDTGIFSPCISPITYTGVPDGSHAFNVRAIDGAGNVDPSPASVGWTVDTLPPDTSITSAPPALTNNNTVNLTFTSTETGSSFTCKLDGNALENCVSPKTYVGLPDGSHTVSVTAMDVAGNSDPAPVIASFTVDTGAPVSTNTASPASPNGQNGWFTTDVSFTITANDGTGSGVATVYACADQANACNPQLGSSGVASVSGTVMPEGVNYIRYQAKDAAGNIEGVKVNQVNIDKTAPTAPVVDALSQFSNADLVNVNWPAVADAVSGTGSYDVYRCEVTSSILTCAPANLLGSTNVTGFNDLGVKADDSRYFYAVKARDNAGLISASSNIVDVTVDKNGPLPPSLSAISLTGFIKNLPAVLNWSASTDPGVLASGINFYKIFRDVISGSLTVINPNVGNILTYSDSAINEAVRYFFKVAAQDKAGNPGGVSSEVDVILDQTAPVTAAVLTPATPNGNGGFYVTSVGVALNCQDVVSNCQANGTKFSLDGGAEQSYTGSFLVGGDGNHAVSFFSTDNAGNVEAAKSVSFKIDQAKPIVTLSALPSLTNSPSLNVSGTANDATSGIANVTVNGAPVTLGIGGSFSQNITLIEGANTITAVAEDNAGNKQSVSALVMLDTISPETTITSAPVSPSGSTAAFVFTANEPVAFECQLDGGAFGLCSSPKVYTGLGAGSHNFAVKAKDTAGNVDPTPAAHSWTVTIDQDNDGVTDNDDDCATVPGSAAQKGCPFADKTRVIIHIVDQLKSGICGTLPDGKLRSECKKPLAGVTVKVFDRENPDFVVAYGQRPKKHLLNVVYESGVGQVGKCVTGADGTCVAGEDHPGKFLVIMKYTEGDKSVYVGKFKNFKRNVIKAFEEEEDDEDIDILTSQTTLMSKTLRFLKLIKKDGSVAFHAGKMTVVTGSELDIVHPENTIWSGATELYPFILTSADAWTTDICLQVPAGYKITGVLNEDGSIMSTSDCAQSFLEGETKVVLFEVAEIGSPEPSFSVNLTTKHGNKKSSQNLAINGIRKATKETEDKQVRDKAESILKQPKKVSDRQEKRGGENSKEDRGGEADIKENRAQGNNAFELTRRGASLWSIVKYLFNGRGNNADIMEAAKEVAVANEIMVPEWGLPTGRYDAKKLGWGFALDITPIQKYLLVR